LLVALVACGDNIAGEDRQGGDTTIDDRTGSPFRQPAANLDAQGRFRFQAGRSPFDFVWEVPKLGPLFNNSACLNCHVGNGRGPSRVGIAQPESEALVRVSLNEGTPDVPGGAVPVPGYGTQLQDHATVGLPEARVTVTWIETLVPFGGGETNLLEPRIDVRTPMGESLPSGTQFSYRIAPPLIGLGLLEAIPESELRALADPDDANGDGISGRLNIVWDPVQQQSVVGRFGWKANTSTLRVQVAAAFVNDMGLTSKVFEDPDGDRDVSDEQFDDTVFFSSTIAVPVAAPRSDEAWRGRMLFDDFGCASCHVPTLVTGEHELAVVANQRIHPYTDLLLHDMGDRLTDARPDFAAAGVEWRTPPLWGVGLTHYVDREVGFMHDGRARTLTQAILWHGGEGAAASEAFRTASYEDRAALLAFLETL
jgi:CxxC motif-containing protein (DUF1111 family)